MATMSWFDYCLLDESEPGEYLDGQLVMTPSPDRQHQLVCRRLANALEAVLPAQYEVNTAWQWLISAAPPANVIPDVMVYPVTDDVVRFTGVPVLVVEVLPHNRADDLTRKMRKYAAAGLPHYWTVDRVAGVLDAHHLDNGAYRRTRRIGRDAAELDFGIATITISVADLLA